MLNIKSVSVERAPAVAGKFYPEGRKRLSSSIDGFLAKARFEGKNVQDAISYVAPHAGYAYSGIVEAFTYKALSMKKDLGEIDTFVFVGPNHTGLGFPVSISGCEWRTPLGVVSNDKDFANGIASQSDLFEMDESAHRLEHSIEVQLPFLQRIVKKPRCCFVCMGNQSLGYCERLCNAIIKSAEEMERNITVIASSDFDHYEPAEVAEKKDMHAIEALSRLDFEEFHKRIEKSGDSACGYGPITVSGMFAKRHGAMRAAMLKYANSGDVTKDYKSVVAYSSIVFV